MTQASIHHLEKVPAFLERIVALNRIHNPDDPVHDRITGDAEDAEAKEARQRLVRIHRHFPEAPMAEQAAYLLRAFNGMRPFGLANHRTGWDYLDDLVRHHDHRILASEAEGRDLGNDIWDRLRQEHPDGITADGLPDRDATHEWLTEWFRHRIG